MKKRTEWTQPWQIYQPYILHTTDEFSSAVIPGSGTNQPSHAIAFRTVDITVNNNYLPPYGGAKLGMYSYWDACGQQSNAPILPFRTQPQQYEFYSYPTNASEMGNEALQQNGSLTTQASAYFQNFLGNSLPAGVPNPQTELYNPNNLTSAVQSAIQAGFCAYVNYLIQNQLTSCTQPPSPCTACS